MMAANAQIMTVATTTAGVVSDNVLATAQVVIPIMVPIFAISLVVGWVYSLIRRSLDYGSDLTDDERDTE